MSSIHPREQKTVLDCFSDEEYPMEEPFTAKEIETRDNCSKILQILDGVMEKGGTVTDGNYLEMCNILKELYKN